MNRVCEFSGAGMACVVCQKAKQKCTGVPAGWRRSSKASHSSMAVKTPKGKGKMPCRSTSPDIARAKTPRTRLKSRARSAVPADPGMTPRLRSRSRARSIATADPVPAVDPAPAAQVPVPALIPDRRAVASVNSQGLVPSEYIYLLFRAGQDVSTGVRLKASGGGNEGQGLAERDEKIRQLEEANWGLRETVMKMGDELTALKNTVNLLLAGHNGLTATVESHRLLLLDQQQQQELKDAKLTFCC